MCEYCDTANFKRLGAEWAEGPSAHGDDCNANLEVDHGEWSICIENEIEWCSSWAKVNNCPWCGRRLAGDAK